MKKKILIIDDDKSILEAIFFILEEYGYQVKTLADGRLAYKTVREFRPDIILLDVLMSGIDGRTICKALTKDKKYADIPILMISAHPTAKNEALECGAQEFIAKPFETDDLIHSIERQLKQKY